MSRGPDCGTLLMRALHDESGMAGCPLTLVDADWTRWSSATFTGARHLSVWRGEPSSQLEAWLEALPEAEIHLRGHLVADLVIAAVERTTAAVTIRIEALTVEV